MKQRHEITVGSSFKIKTQFNSDFFVCCEDLFICRAASEEGQQRKRCGKMAAQGDS